MSELTVDQLTDLRADLGDVKTPPAFEDAELQRLYVRSGENYTHTVILGFDQLLTQAALFTDYTQNETQEKKSQIFDHLIKLRAMWRQSLADEQKTASPTALTALRPIWKRKTRPYA